MLERRVTIRLHQEDLEWLRHMVQRHSMTLSRILREMINFHRVKEVQP